MKKTFYILFGLFTIANLYWVFATPLLPFVDLPFHLAESFVVKHFGNAGYLFERYYSIPTFIKSNTFHTFFCASGLFGDVETANKIYYALYVILLPVSVMYILRLLGGNIYYSLLSFLFTINYSVHWGFVGYTMSVPVLIFLFGLYYTYFVLARQKTGIVITVLLILLFLLHFQTAIFALLVFGILQLIYARKSIRYWIQSIFIILPVMIFMFIAYDTDSKGGTSLPEYLFNYYMLDYAGSVLKRFLLFFILDNFFLFRGDWGSIYAAIISSVVVLVFIFAVRMKNVSNISGKKYILILLIISGICYLLLPDNINGQNIIYERFSVITFLLFTITAGVTGTGLFERISGNTGKLILAGIIALLFFHSAVITDYMNDFRKESRDFSPGLFSGCGNTILAGVVKENDFRGRNIWTHFPMYYTVWRGGVTTGLIDYKFGLIKRNVPKEVLPPYLEVIEDRKTDYGLYYMSAGYIVTKSANEVVLNGFKLQSSSGKWRLYKNIHYVSP